MLIPAIVLRRRDHRRPAAARRRRILGDDRDAGAPGGRDGPGRHDRLRGGRSGGARRRPGPARLSPAARPVRRSQPVQAADDRRLRQGGGHGTGGGTGGTGTGGCGSSVDLPRARHRRRSTLDRRRRTRLRARPRRRLPTRAATPAVAPRSSSSRSRSTSRSAPPARRRSSRASSRSTSCPAARHPVVQYVQGDLAATKAAFIVSPAVVTTDGDGNCDPGRNDCQFLLMRKGDEQTFEYGDNLQALQAEAARHRPRRGQPQGREAARQGRPEDVRRRRSVRAPRMDEQTPPGRCSRPASRRRDGPSRAGRAASLVRSCRALISSPPGSPTAPA